MTVDHLTCLSILVSQEKWDALLHWLQAQMNLWVAFGFVGQAVFFSRFMVQWIASERAGKSIIPIHFWILSIVGSLILFVFAIHEKELVWILGYSVNSVVYIRNMMLLHKEKKAKQGGAA